MADEMAAAQVDAAAAQVLLEEKIRVLERLREAKLALLAAVEKAALAGITPEFFAPLGDTPTPSSLAAAIETIVARHNLIWCKLRLFGPALAKLEADLKEMAQELDELRAEARDKVHVAGQEVAASAGFSVEVLPDQGPAA